MTAFLKIERTSAAAAFARAAESRASALLEERADVEPMIESEVGSTKPFKRDLTRLASAAEIDEELAANCTLTEVSEDARACCTHANECCRVIMESEPESRSQLMAD